MEFTLFISYALVGLLAFIIALYSYGWIENHTVGTAKWVSKKMDMMFMPISAKATFQILMIAPFILGLLVFVLFWPRFFTGLLFASVTVLVGFKLPMPLMGYLSKKRQLTINTQLIDGLTLMSSALRSGQSLVQAVQHTAEEMPDPLSQEMNLILSEHRLGLTIEEAFLNFARRVESEDIEMFVTAVVVLRETGGNLAETFDTIVHTIRERLKLENKVSAMTMQGVFQGTILTLTPFGLAFFMTMVDPKHMEPLFTTWPGYILVFIGLFMLSIGALMIKKIVTIRI